MKGYRIVIFCLICCLIPMGASAKVYRYIDKEGVERFSNEPPPAGAKILYEGDEIKHDAAADQAQQERNKREAAEAASQPAAPPPPKKSAAPAVEAGGDAVPEKKYSRRKHRRKKQIRKEQAEMKKAMEAEAAAEGKK